MPETPRFPHPLTYKDVALVLLVVAVIGGVSLFWPFGRDQGNYAYPAWRWLQGDMPYRDVYVFKPPLTVAVHAVSQVLFGHSVSSIRLLDLLLQGWTAVVLGWMAAVVTGRRAAAWTAAAIYATTFFQTGYWHTAQPDGWFAPLFATAMLLGLAADRSPRRRLLLWAGAGALLGLAFLGKYTALALGLPLAVVALGDPEQSWRRVGTAAAAALAGFAGLLAAAVAAMMAMGFWQAFVEVQRTMVAPYASTATVTIERMFKVQLEEKIRKTFPIAAWGMGGAPIAAWLSWRRPTGRSHLVWVAIAWAVAGLISGIAQRRGFTYHFLPMLPGLAVTFAAGLHLLADACEVPRRARVVLAAVIVGWFAWAGQSWRSYEVVWEGLRGGQSWADILWTTRSRGGGVPFGDQMAVAEWIAAHTEPEDPIFVWSYDPAVMFLARRRQVSRFLYHYPLLVEWHDPADREELLAALEAERPKVFAYSSGDGFGHVTRADSRSDRAFHRFRALKRWVEANYEKVDPIGVYTVYTRRPRSADASASP